MPKAGKQSSAHPLLVTNIIINIIIFTVTFDWNCFDRGHNDDYWRGVISYIVVVLGKDSSFKQQSLFCTKHQNNLMARYYTINYRHYSVITILSDTSLNNHHGRMTLETHRTHDIVCQDNVTWNNIKIW